MTATFWTGSSLSFTNGSKTVTVNTGPSLDSVKANSSLTAGNYNEPVEVKSVSGNTIILYNNWPGSTGTTSATIKPSAAAAASAGVAAQQLITDIQSLVSSASATATANSFVKRDSNGRIKAASPSANDDVVTKGYLGSAATKNVGTASGNLIEVGAFGFGGASPDDVGDVTTVTQGGLFKDLGGTTNSADTSAWWGSLLAMPSDTGRGFLYIRHQSPTSLKAWVGRSDANGSNLLWGELYHSINTNFNEFRGNAANDILEEGTAFGSSIALIYLRINGKVPPSSLSFDAGVTFRIVRSSTNTLIKSNIPPSDLQLTGLSSNKIARLKVINLSGLTTDDRVELQVEQAGKGFEVNF